MAVILYKAFRPTSDAIVQWCEMADWLTGRTGGLQAGRDPLTIVGISGADQVDRPKTYLVLPDGRQLCFDMTMLGTLGRFLPLGIRIPAGREARLFQWNDVPGWNATVVLQYIEGEM